MQRFTIYDVMERKGAFRSNPANAGAQSESGEQLYTGPVEYPKMLYHPDGKTRTTIEAEIIVTPLGPKAVGEKREIIWKIVKNSAEEEALRGAGWHDHPAYAIAAGGGEPPPISSQQRIDSLEAEIKKLNAEKAKQAGLSAGALKRKPVEATA